MERILQYIGSLNHGGAQSVIMNLYRHIDRLSWQFDFVSHHPDEADLVPEIEALGGRCHFIEPLEGTNIVSFLRAWEDFFSRHHEYKVVHLHMRSTASLVVPIAKRHGLATIAHSHSTSNGTGVRSVIKDLLQLPIRRRADYLVGCSTEAARWLFGKAALSRENYVYLPNAIDLSSYAFDEKLRQAKRIELNIPRDAVLFGHVGRLHESKNQPFLLEVFKGLQSRFPGSRLVLVGDGPLRPQIEGLVQSLGLGESVLMLGDRADVPALLSAIDVFLLPSRWEGLPISVIEALAAGLQCYVSDTITHDIDICDSLHRLPPDDLTCWIEEIKTDSRKNNMERIRARGFDINDSVRTLADLYASASKLAISRGRTSQFD